MCCTRPPHVPVATIFKISRYMYIRNALLIRLLKILRQSTTGFALFGAHQVGTVFEFPLTLCSSRSLIYLWIVDLLVVLVGMICQYRSTLYRRRKLLIRLLKIHRQPTTGFALPRAHQVGAAPEFPPTLCHLFSCGSSC
ncbi:hypothetical protein CSKR_109662, partial [Clonorchis sinensis]